MPDIVLLGALTVLPEQSTRGQSSTTNVVLQQKCMPDIKPVKLLRITQGDVWEYGQ